MLPRDGQWGASLAVFSVAASGSPSSQINSSWNRSVGPTLLPSHQEQLLAEGGGFLMVSAVWSGPRHSKQ